MGALGLLGASGLQPYESQNKHNKAINLQPSRKKVTPPLAARVAGARPWRVGAFADKLEGLFRGLGGCYRVAPGAPWFRGFRV